MADPIAVAGPGLPAHPGQAAGLVRAGWLLGLLVGAAGPGRPPAGRAGWPHAVAGGVGGRPADPYRARRAFRAGAAAVTSGPVAAAGAIELVRGPPLRAGSTGGWRSTCVGRRACSTPMARIRRPRCWRGGSVPPARSRPACARARRPAVGATACASACWPPMPMAVRRRWPPWCSGMAQAWRGRTGRCCRPPARYTCW